MGSAGDMPGFPRLRESYDVVVVGGGHAGLQAAVKTALFHSTAAIVDRGPKYSRSYYAPRMSNIPGSAEDISGHALLDRQVAAVRRFEDRIGYFTPARAAEARRTDAGFEVGFDWLKQRSVARGKVLVLAMGVVDRIPVVGGEIKTIFPWANFGIVDFCLFCDGHELSGRSVAVIGHDTYAVRSALDIRHWEPTSVSLLTHGQPLLPGIPETDRVQLLAELDAAHIPIVGLEMAGLDGIREKVLDVRFSDGSVQRYDRAFSALGWYDMNQAIPRSLGCAFDPEGYVVTDEDCRALSEGSNAPIPGLYCVGDQRNGWNQIPEAWATAERAVIHAYASYL
jgi:thioredoxin reductase (NADPH)